MPNARRSLLAWTFVAFVALFTGACRGKGEGDAKPDDLPALDKIAEQQGDATKNGRLQKTEALATKEISTDDAVPPAPAAHDDAKEATDDEVDAKESSRDVDGTDKRTTKKNVDAESPGTKLTLKRIQFAEEISKREPVSAEETFSAAQTGKLYAFIEVDNPEKKRSHVLVTFVPPMGSPSKVELRVGDKSRWRTWAMRRSVKAVGTWTVIVSDAKGGEIGRRSFEVTE
jgi:hypothetical protein